MKYIRVKDNDHLLRDRTTNAIINSDYESYKNYENEYRKKYFEKKRMEQMESDIVNIKSDLDEIKTLLRNLANGS